MKTTRALLAILTAVAVTTLATPFLARAQEGRETDPAAALSSALAAACRANQAQFANYLTADNAAAFHALPQDQQSQFLKRFRLTDNPGRPLISSDPQNHIVLRCEAPGATTEFRFGDARAHENLAFLPVTIAGGQQTEFGMVQESGSWRLLSLGLVLLNIPQLSKEWAEQDLAAREEAALAALRALAEAVQTYRRAWGKLPDSLAELGPAPAGQISPEQADLVNEQVAAGSQGGYRFRYRIIPAGNTTDEKFELAATPEEYGKTGLRSFFYDSLGKIHGADKHGTVATLDDPLLSGEKTP